MKIGEYGIGGWNGTADADVNLVEAIKTAVAAVDPNCHFANAKTPGLQKVTIEAAAGSILTINAGTNITVPASGVLDIPFGAAYIYSIKFAAQTSGVNIIYAY